MSDPSEDFDTITISWHISDVQEVRPDLSDQDARQVLRIVRRYHDACIGVNWEVLQTVADDLFPS